MLLAIPAKILILILILALVVLAVIAVLFYAAAQKMAKSEDSNQTNNHPE
jgi:CHASE3 domain sensor protein